MKDRLIELLKNITSTHYEGDEIVVPEMDIDDKDINRIADHLLDNGVIVLPNLKYGQTVYLVYKNKIVPLGVSSYMIKPEFNNLLQIHLYRNGFNGCCTADDFGKTVFLTKEEAKAALINYGSSKNDEQRKEDEGK